MKKLLNALGEIAIWGVMLFYTAIVIYGVGLLLTLL